MLRVYNTLTRTKEPFEPVRPGKVGIYLCGPTVYKPSHIGHMVGPVIFDTVKRYLEYSGWQVKWVVNITDIDDKIIAESAARGTTMAKLATEMTADYLDNLAMLGVESIDVMPKATEHIGTIVAFIEGLIAKGYAYASDGDVYFDVTRDADYGKLTNRSVEAMQGEGGSTAERKRSAADFALWKKAKPGEPSWESPWGPGRPGWHIECSAMSRAILGEHFDIHGGGLDLIFPHHENEIAQSECANGQTFVNYWLHCQHLVVDNKKMSKSAGNFYTLRDLLQKGFDPLVIRYLLISSHYRKLLNFSFDNLEMAGQSMNRIKNFEFALKNVQTPGPENQEIKTLINASQGAFVKNLADDFNISGALGVLFDFIYQVNLKMSNITNVDALLILKHMQKLDLVLGILPEPKSVDLETIIADKIAQREKARENKDFAQADAIRTELKQQGIVLLDTPDGVKWKKG